MADYTLPAPTDANQLRDAINSVSPGDRIIGNATHRYDVNPFQLTKQGIQLINLMLRAVAGNSITVDVRAAGFRTSGVDMNGPGAYFGLRLHDGADDAIIEDTVLHDFGGTGTQRQCWPMYITGGNDFIIRNSEFRNFTCHPSDTNGSNLYTGRSIIVNGANNRNGVRGLMHNNVHDTIRSSSQAGSYVGTALRGDCIAVQSYQSICDIDIQGEIFVNAGPRILKDQVGGVRMRSCVASYSNRGIDGFQLMALGSLARNNRLEFDTGADGNEYVTVYGKSGSKDTKIDANLFIGGKLNPTYRDFVRLDDVGGDYSPDGVEVIDNLVHAHCRHAIKDRTNLLSEAGRQSMNDNDVRNMTQSYFG